MPAPLASPSREKQEPEPALEKEEGTESRISHLMALLDDQSMIDDW